MMQADEKPRLPRLRPELSLVRGAPAATGEPSWLISDPIQNKFIQIDPATYQVLSAWPGVATRNELLDRLRNNGAVDIDDQRLDELVGFLHNHKLTLEAPRGGWRYYADEHVQKRQSPFGWLIHNYLFFRIPLFRPQRFLERTLATAQAAGNPWMRAFLHLVGAIGLYLVSRQWDEYVGTFQSFFTWEGAALIALALIVVKSAHELAHAYTAAHYGCRVHSIGIAFMLLTPLLYTDVTDAWRLRQRRQRLMIDSAGIRMEIAIAELALFAWAFLPEGPWRSLAFVLSAVSLALSLAINLNPFMRFDGYYLLSEMLGVENMQSRAFALGRWQVREWLFGQGAPCPEELSRPLVRTLTVYAFATWIYRLFLFVGIALLVYHYTFKVLGIVLFAIEIIYFVIRPVWSEMKLWYSMRGAIAKTPRFLVTSAIAVTAAAALIVPWSTVVEIPAVLEMTAVEPVFSPRPARIRATHVRHGETVAAGQPLVTLDSPDIALEIAMARTRLKLATLQHGRRGADETDREASLVIERTIYSLRSNIQGLEREWAELVVRAPIDGRVVEFNSELHPGRWLGPKERIATVAGENGYVARGYVSETDLWRVERGNRGRFIPENAMRPAVDVEVGDIAIASSAELAIADLASNHAGRIAVNVDEKNRLVPAAAQYMVHLPARAGAGAHEIAVRGVVIVHGKAESLIARVWRQVLKVLVREAGA